MYDEINISVEKLHTHTTHTHTHTGLTADKPIPER